MVRPPDPPRADSSAALDELASAARPGRAGCGRPAGRRGGERRRRSRQDAAARGAGRAQPGRRPHRAGRRLRAVRRLRAALRADRRRPARARSDPRRRERCCGPKPLGVRCCLVCCRSCSTMPRDPSSGAVGGTRAGAAVRGAARNSGGAGRDRTGVVHHRRRALGRPKHPRPRCLLGAHPAHRPGRARAQLPL